MKTYLIKASKIYGYLCLIISIGFLIITFIDDYKKIMNHWKWDYSALQYLWLLTFFLLLYLAFFSAVYWLIAFIVSFVLEYRKKKEA